MPLFFIFLRAACKRAVLPTPYSPSRATEIWGLCFLSASRILKTKVMLDYMLGPTVTQLLANVRRVRVDFWTENQHKIFKSQY